jgi:tRNA nucleotidyltransferase/poly(A) polymerase
MKFAVPYFVNEIIDKFQENNYEIYIVGGAVRDLLRKGIIDDWDFTTNATPQEILNLFPEGFYDNDFGTVGISHESQPNPYEITTFRKEYGYSDKRRPDKIKWGKTLKEDIKRRDFTINAMALRRKGEAGNETTEFELIDPYEGQKDLDKKIIRAVGKAKERFSEDALRMMRAVRIAAELGFDIEDKTKKAIKDNAKLIDSIAKERIKDELFKLLASSHPAKGVKIFKEVGLMKEILPELENTFGVEQKSPGRHHIYDVGTHSILSLKHVAQKNTSPLVRFATLIHDIGKPQTFKKLKNETITFYNHEVVGKKLAGEIADRLRFSKKEKDKLLKMVRWHQFTLDENQTDSAIRRFIRNVGKENVPDMLDLRVGDRLGGGARETSWRLEEFKKRLIEVQKQPFAVHDLKINGDEIMKILNIEPGPKVGQILDKLFEEVSEKKLPNEKDVLMEKVKEIKYDD